MAGADLTPIYYLAGIATTVGSGLVGARAYLGKQRDRWITEGTKQASLADRLDANTKAADANTAALAGLGQQMQAFMTRTETTLNIHAGRLDRMEQAVMHRRWDSDGSGN